MNPFWQSTLAYAGAMTLEFIGVSTMIILYNIKDEVYAPEERGEIIITKAALFIVATALIVGGFDLVRRFVI